MNERKYIYIGIGFGFTGMIFLLLARYVDGFSQWYATTIYPCIVATVGRIFGIVPISLSEIGLYILAVVLVVWLIQAIHKKQFRVFIARVFSIAMVLLFLYSVNCGVNYYRVSFAESAGFAEKEYSVNDLKETCVWLTKEVNYWADCVNRQNSGVMMLDAYTPEEAVKAMKKLGESYSEVSGYYPQPKGLLNHWILSVQQLSGVYSPFTVEANYNTGMTDYNIPFTACHELSHLKGYMQEEEANFLAFLACQESENAEFKYSGYMLGWIHCMNLLYRIDYESWEEIRECLSNDIVPDLKENSAFWNKYDGKVAEVADRVNDTYLKANGQSDGVESYGRMADLIVIYHKKIMNKQVSN